MIIVLKQTTDEKQLNHLTEWLGSHNLDIQTIKGSHSTVLGLVGDTSSVDIELLEALDIVESVKRIQEPYKKANRKFHPDDTVINVGGAQIGGGSFTIMAGPCSVESEEQIC